MFIEFDGKLINANNYEFFRGIDRKLDQGTRYMIFARCDLDEFKYKSEYFLTESEQEKRWDEIRLELNVIRVR